MEVDSLKSLLLRRLYSLSMRKTIENPHSSLGYLTPKEFAKNETMILSG
jgi:hypothetical protein